MRGIKRIKFRVISWLQYKGWYLLKKVAGKKSTYVDGLGNRYGVIKR